ncbi:MAG: PQQ-dependent dehydrogenase, methanol/ethanol family [Gemmatimonadota bacterium]|nr:PQQ-dependent dehydrogenase, methanol/ethanol family [Gemmatimonadota bacterium]
MSGPMLNVRVNWLVLGLSFCFATPAVAQVPYQRLLDAQSDHDNWLTYSGTYNGHRFSPLAEINTETVKDLVPKWIYQVKNPGIVETTPLVVDGVMYVTEPPSNVTALDAETGRTLWRWTRPMPDDLIIIGFPRVNRGVAVLDDRVFVATLDGYLVALDASSGNVRWETHVADNALAHSLTLAPLAIDGKVIVGISGGEAGIRGFIDAYDSDTGELSWRTWTIPGPGEPGNETWGGDSWMHGAGATWLTGSYDPDLDLLYWGIGNPGPDWNGDVRPGDNLYTSGIMALEGETGKMRWHFQATPHDTHDWDSNQIPILLDAEWEGKPRKLLLNANRNAFYYVLDRETGEFLHGLPYAKQTWAEGLDDNGRPIKIPGMEPSYEGTLVWPSLQGATNWFSPSYSPLSKNFYVSVREMSAIYYKTDVEYEEGRPYMGGGEQRLDGDQAQGWIYALDALSGKRMWEFRLHSPPWSGVMSTAGNLVFGASNEGNFFALDATSGEALWSFYFGAGARTNPMSFRLDSNEYVVFAGGNSIYVFGLSNDQGQ